jgi:thiol:disulfide interchange protein
MRRRALLAGLLAAACGKSRKSPPALFWFDDVDLAYREATRVHRPVFLVFGATWDMGTKELEHRTFPDPEVGALLDNGFVCARVDCSDDETEPTMRLTREFDIKGVPTLVVTDAARHDLWRVTQYTTPDKLAILLRRTRARHDASANRK